MNDKKVYALLTDTADGANFYLLIFDNLEEYNIFKKTLNSMESIAETYGGYPEIGDPKSSVEEVLCIAHQHRDYSWTYENKEFFEKYNL